MSEKLTRRFVRKDYVSDGRPYFRVLVPKEMQERLGWKQQPDLYEMVCLEESGCIKLKRITV